jgi:hypothetical protein
MGIKARHHTSKGFIKTSERKQNYLGIILWWKLNYSKSCSVRTVNYNAVRPIRQDVHRAQQSFSRPPFLNRGPRPVINRFPVIKFPPQYNA